MPLVLRSVKGTALTHNEVDGNFVFLDDNTTAHIDDNLNPHGVTAAQSGADPAGTSAAGIAAHEAAANIHPIAGVNGLQAALDAKQDTLIAGTNITIDGVTISASGGGGGADAEGWTPIETIDIVGAVTNIDIALDFATYDQIRIVGKISAAGATPLRGQFSIDGGSTFETAGYGFSYHDIRTYGTPLQSNLAAGSEMSLGAIPIGVGFPAEVAFTITKPASITFTDQTAIACTVRAVVNTAATGIAAAPAAGQTRAIGSFSHATLAVNAIRIKGNVQNLADPYLRVIGRVL